MPAAPSAARIGRASKWCRWRRRVGNPRAGAAPLAGVGAHRVPASARQPRADFAGHRLCDAPTEVESLNSRCSAPLLQVRAAAESRTITLEVALAVGNEAARRRVTRDESRVVHQRELYPAFA